MSHPLPRSWAKTTLGEVSDISSGYGFPERLQGRTEGDVPFFKVGDISEAWKRGEVFLSKATHYISKDEVEELRATPLPSNTTVFAKIGAAIGLNRRAMLAAPSLVDNNVMGLCPKPGVIEPKYLYYFACTLRLMELAKATTVPSVRKTEITPITIPLAPIREQSRIVAEIEKQFTRLDDAVTALKRVQANLKRYRASVLKAACEGRLVPTEAELARKERRDYEPAAELLKRILVERRTKWQADQLQKMIAAGKPPEDDGWKAKYSDPIKIDGNNLPSLPKGWQWATLDAVLLGIEAGRSFKCEERPPEADEIGVVKVSAVTWGEFDEQESKTCLDLSRHDAEFLIHERDFLFSRANTIELVGACVIVRSIHKNLMLSDKILRFRLASYIPPAWILYVLRSEWGRYEIERLSTGNQESMRNIGQDRIRSIRVPIPPAEEIERILKELDLRNTASGEASKAVADNLVRSARLRKATLTTAFAGKLVPQGPNDEPASVLLERIRAERARAQEQKEKTPKAANGASRTNGQRRRRVKELAQGVSPGKG
jgi:type I restriction enzyme S subunit